MRWTIPTLIQQLVDQGVRPLKAGDIVAITYPETRGDTFHRWQDPDDREQVAVGVYGLWNRLRGDQMPLGGTKVSDDARTIAQFLRLNPRSLTEIVHASDKPDFVIRRVADEAVAIIESGGRFEPRRVEPDDPKETLPQRIAGIIAKADGAADYLSSLTPPRFGA